jgi:hypothetical protein
VTFDNLLQVAVDFSLSPAEHGILHQRLVQGLRVDVHSCTSITDPPGQGTDAILLSRTPMTAQGPGYIATKAAGGVPIEMFVIAKRVVYSPCGDCNPQLYDPCPNHSNSRRTSQPC